MARPALAGLLQQLNRPAVHFLLIGALVFLVHRHRNPPARRIAVSQELLDGLARDHQRRTGVLPTAAEGQALLHQYLDDEILYREALALGLDRGDIIVRRRLLQKMELLAEAEVAEPSDAELQAYLQRHPDRYALPGRTSLVHVFIASERHGAATPAVAAALRARLLESRDDDLFRQLGDPFVRGAELRDHSDSALAGIFGDDFARRVADLADGWSTPLPSRYGLHLVRITRRQPRQPAPLAAVREPLRRDLREEQRATARRLAVERLRCDYTITLPAPGRPSPWWEPARQPGGRP